MITNGVDIISIERISNSLKRSGDAFLKRVCTEKEAALMGKGTEIRLWYAWDLAYGYGDPQKWKRGSLREPERTGTRPLYRQGREEYKYFHFP